MWEFRIKERRKEGKKEGRKEGRKEGKNEREKISNNNLHPKLVIIIKGSNI